MSRPSPRAEGCRACAKTDAMAWAPLTSLPSASAWAVVRRRSGATPSAMSSGWLSWMARSVADVLRSAHCASLVQIPQSESK